MNPQFRQIISEIDLQRLETCLTQSLPHSTQMLNLVRLKLQKRFSKCNKIEIYLYEDPKGNETDEPFVVCTQAPNLHTLHGVITLAPKSLMTPRMLETFDDFIDWDKVELFSNLNASFANHLKLLSDKHGNRTNCPNGLQGSAYFLGIEKALSFPDYIHPTTEDTIEVKHLGVEDADEIVRNWKFALPHSKGQIQETIKSMDSRGVYVNSALASSAVLSPMGLINILHTDEKHRRKGYGEITMQALSKSIASIGIFPGAEFEAGNDKSKRLLEKVGFEFVHDVLWMFYEK